LFLSTMSNGSRIRKVIAMNNTFGLLESTGAALTLFELNPASTTGVVLVNLATVVAAAVVAFDAATSIHTTATHVHVVYQVGTALTYVKVTISSGAVSGTKVVLAAGGSGPAIASNDTIVHVGYIEATDGKLLTFSATTPFTTSAGPTTLNPTFPISHLSIAIGGTSIFVGSNAPNITGPAHIAFLNVLSANHVSNVSTRYDAYTMVSGVVAKDGTGGFGFTRRMNTGGVSGYTGISRHWFQGEVGNCDVPFGQDEVYGVGQNAAGDMLVILSRDPGTTTAQTTVRKMKFMSTARRRSAVFGDALYITGGSGVDQWVGGLCENGIVEPIITQLVAANSTGVLALGAYSYLATIEWTDELQRLHRSVVSPIFNITLVGVEDTVTATIVVPKSLRRNPNVVSNPIVKLFRTEVGPGELFYLVGIGQVPTLTDTVTIIDTQADATIIDNERPYTEGEFGAVSGVLDIAVPSPGDFVAATRRRLVLGSMDSTYQISQTTLPNEPVCFTQIGVSGPVAFSYFDQVREHITGFVALDDMMIVGTKTKLYAQGGAGPNLAGTGEFDAPAMLSTDVGFFNANSILETAEGIWFQGSATGMYLLPRGSGTPVLDNAQQVTLAGGTIVGCGYNASDNVAAWALSSGLVLIRDLGSKQWFHDDLPFFPVAFMGHLGSFYAIDTFGDVWEQDGTLFGDIAAGASAPILRVNMGAVQPFGLAGTGRVPTIEVTGEFQAACTLTLNISYDDGATFPYSSSHTITGLATGATFRKQWYPNNQRGGRFMFRVTMTPTVSTTEGCRLTGCTVYLAKPGGPSRLASAHRK
jgi:hypothetical protein